MKSSDITPRSLYLRRRDFLKLGAGSAAMLALPAFGKTGVPHGARLASVTPNPKYALPEEKKNSFDDIASYNNFYELGTDKSDPSENAGKLVTQP
ncbi:MAG TPA: mononuclear molybdenum enzyme YedY, partial [Myxococcales bacterium]|nr:mononuclear molybdenum enzyme YedY [Myxococcales bacterium]